MERTVVDLAAAAFKNARSMQTSAQALLDVQQWPSAFAFAALALEEIGKAALCTTMLAMPPVGREAFRPDFERACSHHQTKAELAHLILGMVADTVPASLQQLLDDVAAEARRTNTVKFRGLYTDYTDTGALLLPDDTVSESDARWMVITLTTALDQSSSTEAAVADDPGAYLDLLRQWQNDVDFDALSADVANNPDQFLTQIRAFVRDDVPPPTHMLGTRLSARLTEADVPTKS
ncbi:AbiV family abortive infection protein [Streptomyces phaeochromogenes]